MVIRKGYKQTELGVIPEDWEVVPLSSIASIERGKFTHRPRNDPAFYGGKYPFIQTGDVESSNGKITKFTQTLNEKGLSVSKLFPKKTIVITIAANIGSTAITTFPVCFPDSLIGIIPNNMNTEFLEYFLKTKKRYLNKTATNSAQKNINLEALKPLLIIKPDNDEQQKISSTISDIEKLINSLESLIQKKKNIMNGTMQELLTEKRRLCGFNKKWKTKSLAEIGEIAGAGVDKKIKDNEKSVRLVNYLDVYRNNFIDTNDLDHFVTAPIQQASRCSIKKGDIFFTPSSEMPTDIGVSAISLENISDACYSYHVVRLRLFENWDLKFRAYIFKTKNFLNQCERICEGSGTRYVITLKKFKNLEVKFPVDIKEQYAISQILFDMEMEIEYLKKQMVKYTNLKQAMMQKLLTGEIRLV